MDHPVREIPGFYYDCAKKKYFAIQAHAPASTAYSAQDVKRRKTRDDRTASKILQELNRKGRIQRSKILAEPLTGDFLKREYGGGGPSPGIRATDIIARSLTSQGKIYSLQYDFRSTNSVLFSVESREAKSNIRLVYDNLLLGHEIDWNNDHVDCRRTTNGAWFAPSGDSTSLSTHRGTGHTAFTWLATSSAAGIGIVPRMFSDGPPIVFGPGTTRGTEVDILSSTPAPIASSILFAFGSSHGILTVDKNLDLSWLTPRRRDSIDGLHNSYPTDVFALEFLSDNHSILLSGGRKGLLDIIDLRLPNFGTHADVINHPSSITHIKQLDSHRIIVAGLNSTMCQYDLRFRKDTVQSGSPAEQRQHQKSRRDLKATRPILQYPDFWNNARIGLGFDIDFEAGIVAAAQEQDEFHPSVQLFSLHGGDKLRSPAVSKTSLPFEEPQYVKCLQFAGHIEQGIKSLWIGEGRDIRRFSWADEANVTVDLY